VRLFFTAAIVFEHSRQTICASSRQSIPFKESSTAFTVLSKSGLVGLYSRNIGLFFQTFDAGLGNTKRKTTFNGPSSGAPPCAVFAVSATVALNASAVFGVYPPRSRRVVGLPACRYWYEVFVVAYGFKFCE
jgi:hypothetical protein